ncbi:hypothetical protein [Roseomonas sp. CECT 9278]|uniref:hypothetical protein n=1 Tax=Roseomonas sp. CECT 9278 TaxID=2845823 RepID=UPI001E35EB1E|nr:hypothetical protein [Roseomonas sp. CECT 9278]CAH0169795.1 hypothetical protein ROS9278_01167 [Roseomonas sp. CECT 9278]
MTDDPGGTDIVVDVRPILTLITEGFLRTERQSRDEAAAATAHLPADVRAAVEHHRRQVMDAIVADAFKHVVKALVTFRETGAPPTQPVLPNPPIPDPPPGSSIN